MGACDRALHRRGRPGCDTPQHAELHAGEHLLSGFAIVCCNQCAATSVLQPVCCNQCAATSVLQPVCCNQCCAPKLCWRTLCPNLLCPQWPAAAIPCPPPDCAAPSPPCYLDWRLEMCRPNMLGRLCDRLTHGPAVQGLHRHRGFRAFCRQTGADVLHWWCVTRNSNSTHHPSCFV